ncbi:type II secretion system major pseudopilin GspG [Roseateles asaccharophilus]|uniref:Type II secretion system core protein G n=1 Tax=Roseateles asaccharophilus TaxID=582607 RepID=A0ABU2AFK2_9BURK|nr:type II secretion system major pseudopilin GspG [Roseateles asaccharophilus]MDR7335398.1 general secretion pathway protein G [Roseateles asaccharophilus]
MPRSPVHRNLGFTLLELLIVLLIIGLLTGIVGPRFMSQMNRSETTTAQAQIDALGKAVQAYRIDMGRYPDNAVGLKALVQPPSDPRWRGPYLNSVTNGEIPRDPWGSPYVYRSPGVQGRDFDILSYGRDRAMGGGGEDADVRN